MEKRRSPRSRTFKGGRIVFNNRFSTVDCIVRNMSATGALLEVPIESGIPDQFILILKMSNEEFRCRVAWRKETRMGVEFV